MTFFQPRHLPLGIFPVAVAPTAVLLFFLAAASPRAASQTPPPAPGILEDLAGEAMTAILLDDRDALKNIRERTKAHEDRPRSPDDAADSPVRPTARTSDILALFEAWMEPSPREKTRLLEAISASDPAPAVERQARHALAYQRGARIRQLRREDRYNRFAHVFNLFTQLAAGAATANPQALLHRFVDLFFIKEHLTKITPRNRQALDSFKRWEKETLRPWNTRERPPGAPAAPERDEARKETREELLDLIHYADRVQRRLDRLRARRAVERGNWLLARERWPEARSSFALALEIDKGNETARKGQLEAARRISAEHRARLASLRMPPRQAPASEDEILAARKVALALCDGRPREIRAAAPHFRTLG